MKQLENMKYAFDTQKPEFLDEEILDLVIGEGDCGLTCDGRTCSDTCGGNTCSSTG